MANGRLKAGLVTAVVFGSMLIGGKACSSEKVVERVIDESGQTVDTPTDGVPVEPTSAPPRTYPEETPIATDGQLGDDQSEPTTEVEVVYPTITYGPSGELVLEDSNPNIPLDRAILNSNLDFSYLEEFDPDPDHAEEIARLDWDELDPGKYRVAPAEVLEDFGNDGAYSPEEIKKGLAGLQTLEVKKVDPVVANGVTTDGGFSIILDNPAETTEVQGFKGLGI